MLLTTKGHALSLLSVVTSNSPAQRYFMAPEFKNLKYRSQTVLYPISTVASQRISTVRSLPLPTFLFTNPWFPHFPKFQISPSKISLSLSLSLSHWLQQQRNSLMKMAFISETASAIKSRFGFHDHASKSSSTSSSPDLLKSTSKDNNAAVAHSNSVVRTISNWDEDDTVSVAGSSSTQSFDFDEDPSFWKDHNVQVRNYNWWIYV